MSQTIQELKMESLHERRESRVPNRRRISMAISKMKGPRTQFGLLPRERSMSSDLESIDMRPLKRVPKLENTYRTDPKQEETFSCSKMEGLMKDVMEEVIGSTTYDPITCNALVTTVANRIKDSAKIYPWTRYRFIVYVIIGQNSKTTIEVGSRCLWNEHHDTYASYKYENKTMYAVATCYAIYLD